MPLTCSALNCTNRFKKGAGISFHRFPFRNKKILASWVEGVGRDDWQPKDTSSLCSQHFESKWFYETNGNRKLLNLAVPTIFDYSDHKKGRKTRKKRKFCTPAELSENGNTSLSSVKLQQKGKKQSMSSIVPSESNNVSNSSAGEGPNKSSSQQSVLTRSKMKYAFQITEESLNTKKIKVENNVNSSINDPKVSLSGDLEVKVQEFDEVMQELSLRLNSYQGSLIIRACFGDVIKDILRNPQTKVVEYSKRVKRLASTVHFYSVKAYDYLRSKAKLPHPSTLFHWATVSGGKPGFTEETFVQISKQVKSTQFNTDASGNLDRIYCSLIIDEIQLKKDLEFDGKEIIGYCDLGHGDLSDDQMPLAKEALVFMAIAINRNWKLPLGYCFIDVLEGSVRANLVRMYLQKIHEAGLECVSVACDGAGHNLVMFSELGVELNGATRKNWFAHPCDPKKKVYSFFDVAYMIKTLRNVICEKGTIIDSSKQQGDDKIEWRFFKNLHVLQEQIKEGENSLEKPNPDAETDVSDGKKMKDVFLKQKEKYGLTEEVLSGSVSLALKFCQRLNVDEFQGSSTTAEFASRIDDIFDLLNSNFVLGCGNKSPVMKKNKSIILKRIDDSIRYLEGLKEQGPGDLCAMINGQRKVGILGLIFNLLSVRDLSEQLVWGNSAPLIGLLTENVSQGHMESFFSSVRKYAGGVPTLTALEFRSAYRKCMMQSICVHSKGASWAKMLHKYSM